ncbi:c-type cytochrome [Algicella marina]|uniref:C-type cytochrome n=1 Tax=Algicella marina TaxID=2683284 RepID=A0A6P1T1D4_9RHOB|nr:c-type cytochrome [Algicella marina]QHQ35797.1 c-type cytochrome [Algicella marina]
MKELDLRTAFVVVAAAAGIAAVVAVAVVWLGLYNVSARKGHLPGVGWVLHTTFRNSVALRAPPDDVVPEDLDTPAMVALGAGHFMSACAGCHGAPGITRSATVRQMMPEPPRLDNAGEEWSAAELFWIVKNGAKMTGMPGWPARRSDDVWPVVAFLRSLGDMSAAEYATLTDSSEGTCTICHGKGGVSDNPHVPRLDILSADYIAHSLQSYANGSRDSGIMAQVAVGMDDETITRLASSFDELGPVQSESAAGDALRGQQLSASSDGSHDVPACRACHGPWPEPLNSDFPSLAGQQEPYLRRQLELWRSGNHGGGPAVELMYKAARDLTDDQIADLAAYYSSLTPAPLNRVAD